LERPSRRSQEQPVSNAARAAIRDLEEGTSALHESGFGSAQRGRREERVRKEIITLATAYRLASSETSFVAVEHREGAEGHAGAGAPANVTATGSAPSFSSFFNLSDHFCQYISLRLRPRPSLPDATPRSRAMSIKRISAGRANRTQATRGRSICLNQLPIPAEVVRGAHVAPAVSARLSFSFSPRERARVRTQLLA
jgi:hypothetical protein